jgi:hypothetical protein
VRSAEWKNRRRGVRGQGVGHLTPRYLVTYPSPGRERPVCWAFGQPSWGREENALSLRVPSYTRHPGASYLLLLFLHPTPYPLHPLFHSALCAPHFLQSQQPGQGIRRGWRDQESDAMTEVPEDPLGGEIAAAHRAFHRGGPAGRRPVTRQVEPFH